MKTWFTSDHHFGHANIMKHCDRPFVSTGEMNDHMVRQWNSVVGIDDRVIHLGDLYWSKDVTAKQALRQKLNGRICLIAGNHDRPQQMLSDETVDELLPLVYKETFTSSAGIDHVLVMCHYPMQEWDQFFRGAIHLHGHCHGNAPGQVTLSAQIRRLDVSGDCHDFLPLCVDDILRILKID